MGKDQELLDAARNGDIIHVGKLLDLIVKRAGPLSSFRRSPSINSQDVNGYTPLHHACLNGHSEVVRLLLSHNAKVDVPDIRGSTPLYLAAWAGQLEIVKILLMNSKTPANPNAQTSENETALHCAAQHGHNAVLAILLAYGADPNIRNNSFQTALDLAAQFGRLQAVQVLIRSHPTLIEQFKNVKLRNNSYSPAYTITPSTHIFTHSCLHLASRNGHKKVVETLLAAGVDVNVMTHAGTALHEAALCGKKSVVDTLLKAGIDPHALDGNGRTALDVLKDYPPHVTYEIVSTIKEFCNLSESDAHFRPIVAEKSEVEKLCLINKKTNEKFHSLPRSRYENKLKFFGNLAEEEDFNNTKLAALSSNSLNSISNQTNTVPRRASYVPMKPILTQATSTESINDKERLYQYKPVYKQPYTKSFVKAKSPIECNGNLQLPCKSYELMCLTTASDSSNCSSNCDTPELRLRSVNEYAEECVSPTSTPTPSSTSTRTSLATPTPTTTANKFEFNGYRNINMSDDMKSQTKDQQYATITPKRILVVDANNNKEHSPTPDFPPPSVSTAEETIFEFIAPRDTQQTQHSIIMDADDLFNLDSYFYECAKLQKDGTEQEQSPISDHVEEFIADKPFAGLFKGSTLNLANGDDESVYERQSLRSPSLVKSIQPIPPQRNASLKPRTLREMKEFSASRVWAEIDDIFEKIGNEVQQNIEEIEKSKNLDKSELDIVPKDHTKADTLPIRNPSELLLNNVSAKATPTTTIWLHSLDALLYGQVKYEVYYLGSTVIQNLQGTTSTRMSIQKLKIDEREIDMESDADLLKDCTSSTKYLKANNLQTRLAVGIALSYLGVEFIDIEKKSMICIHATENINCVCQDAEDLRYFAYITKENYIYYCHVFMVDNVELAKEIILTLGQAFEIAYQLAITNNAICNNNDATDSS